MCIPTTRRNTHINFIHFNSHLWSHDGLDPGLEVGEINRSRLALPLSEEFPAERRTVQLNRLKRGP